MKKIYCLLFAMLPLAAFAGEVKGKHIQSVKEWSYLVTSPWFWSCTHQRYR